MKSKILAMMSALVVIAGLSSARATGQAIQQRHDFIVKFEWDSVLGSEIVKGDSSIIDDIQRMLSAQYGSYFNVVITGYTKLDDKNVAVLSKIIVTDKTLRSNISDTLHNSLIERQGAYLYVIDVEAKNPVELKVQLGDFNVIGGGLYGSPYGCMQNHIPIFRADLNHDGHPEIFYFISKPNGINFGVDDWVDLHMLRGTDFKQIWSGRLISDNASSDGGYLFDRSDIVIEPYKPGVHSYTKLFFGNLENKKQLDLLVWRREYAATTMKFSSEQFELYTMLPDVTFSKSDLTSEQGHMLLEKNSLTWKQGFPNQNFCNSEGRPTDKPLIPNIDDPVLKQ